MHIDLFEQLVDNLVFKAVKYGRIFDFWILIYGIKN